ncbi:hypothetical protein V6N11_078953 [Hibiscus sabdariffa]|uniref:Uncharacterized protein n=2 Tax=Hibiscus sabdariffa TaxID=183260 RepID=A0ABR2RUA7_9ROSI
MTGAESEAEAALGPRSPTEGAGDGAAPAAMTALIEEAATMMAQETFFMSMACKERRLLERNTPEKESDLPFYRRRFSPVLFCYLLCRCRSKKNGGGESDFIEMAHVSILKAVLVALAVSILTATASAQVSEAPSPSPTPDAGAGISVTVSSAAVGFSLIVSLLALLKV